jgi:uncharacterized protein Yka (UPF0111/DUF47 family)
MTREEIQDSLLEAAANYRSVMREIEDDGEYLIDGRSLKQIVQTLETASDLLAKCAEPD